MKMILPTEVFGSVVVAHTPDELSTDYAEDVLGFLTTLEHVCVVADMDMTDVIDSGGLGMLLDVQEELQNSGGDLKISTNNAINRKILEITRIDQQIEVFGDVIDAVKSYS